MEISIMSKILNATNGGLDIFRNYLSHSFELDQMVEINNIRFIVSWNAHYGNYVIRVEEREGTNWSCIHRFNAVWFVKEKFNLTKDTAIIKIDSELNLGVLKSSTNSFLNI